MKRVLFPAVLLFFVTYASAQFNFGIKAGYNSSLTLNNLGSVTNGGYTLDNVRDEMWDNFQAGLFARIFIDKFYIQPELLYSVQKKEYNMTDVMINGNTRNVDSYMEVSNVEVPLMLGYKLLDMKMINLRVFAGPNFILNTGSKLAYKNLTNPEIKSANLLEDFKKAQINLELGAGADLFMFALDFRLNLVQDVAGKFQSAEDLAQIQPPTSAFVVSIAWKLF